MKHSADEIQQRALETWYHPDNPLYLDALPAAMGLAGETGELIDWLKKTLFKPGFEIDWNQFDGELGDVLFYLAILAHQRGLTLDDLSRLNYYKLQHREQNGTGYNRGQPLNERCDR